MTRILVTGAAGYVGGRFVERAARDLVVHALWRTRPPPAGIAHQLDLDDTRALAEIVRRVRPDVVLHAAYDPNQAAEPNLRWGRHTLTAAKSVGARFVLISTDMVFDGTRGWYREDDPPNAVLPYGRWKTELEGEVLSADGVVARTALVWGLDPPSTNVEQLVLAPLRAGATPRLYADEWRTPTEVHELAEALLQACAVRGPRVLHLAGAERVSRLDLGRLIARRFGYDPALLPGFDRPPERPRDISLELRTTREVITAPLRGPTELLSRGGAGNERPRSR